jgi:hypothetical protein
MNLLINCVLNIVRNKKMYWQAETSRLSMTDKFNDNKIILNIHT